MTGRILPDLTQADIHAEIARLMAENARLKAKANQGRSGKLTFRVGDKGNVCVYGLGRFPVSLYRSQWESLLGQKEAILGFIEANASQLATKD